MDSELARLVWLVVPCSTTGKPKGEEREPEQNRSSLGRSTSVASHRARKVETQLGPLYDVPETKRTS